MEAHAGCLFSSPQLLLKGKTMNATAKPQEYDTSSPLYRTVSTTPTDY